LPSLDEELVLYLPFSEGAEGVSSPSQTFDESLGQNNGSLNGPVLVKPYESMDIDSGDEGDNPLVVYDDDETFWTGGIGGAGAVGSPTLSEETTIVQKGSSSLKGVIGAGAGANPEIYHNYGAGQDWSQYDLISFWFYGANAGKTIRLFVANEVRGAWANYNYYEFTDNFTGWRRLIFPMEHPDGTGGALNWTSVLCIGFVIYSAGTDTYYVDRTTLDVGNWRFGEAAHFDGSNDFVDCGTIRDSFPAITISAWIYIQSIGNHVIVAKDQDGNPNNATFNFNIDSNRNVRWAARIGNIWEDFNGSIVLSLNTWHHVVVVYDGTTMIIYVDGLRDPNTNAASGIMIGGLNSNVYVGMRQGGSWGPTDGYIDEVRIYNRALSPEEIRLLYERMVK
jgi:hypothetical protein